MLWKSNTVWICFLIFAVISELIHHSAAGSSGGAAVNMPLIQVIVPQIMNLKAQLMDSSKVLYHLLFLGLRWIPMASHAWVIGIWWFFPVFFYFYFQDEEDVKAIARLFADMGDSYVELIAAGIYHFPLLKLVILPAFCFLWFVSLLISSKCCWMSLVVSPWIIPL